MTSPESSPTSPQANADSVTWFVKNKLISNVTTSENAVITTTTDHGYSTGMYVLINVPIAYGMTLNSVTSKILVLSATDFQTTINTMTKSAFSPPAPGFQCTPAQVSPISGLFYNATPGSPTGNPLG